MSKRRISAKKRIHKMCDTYELREEDIYGRAKLLLDIYRDVCWNTTDCANLVREEIWDYTCSKDLNDALIYLETFAPECDRDDFEDRIRKLFQVSWLIELADTAMMKVRDCPINGPDYFDILSVAYMNGMIRDESDILMLLNMERSTYYRKRKEAIVIFGLALWGSSIAEYRERAVPRQLSFSDGSFM